MTVDGERVAAIGAGLLALVGIESGDDAARAVRLAGKTARARLFPDGERPFETSVRDDPARSVLVVSQFTLAGDMRRGNRPSWARAAPPEVAAPLVDAYAEALRAEGVAVCTGRFGAHMQVSLVNDGPVTVVLDGEELERSRR